MTVLHHLVLAAHLLGVAAVLSGWFVWRRAHLVEAFAVWGARVQLLTGALLVGLLTMADADQVSYPKVVVKLAVAVAVVGAYEVANARARKGHDVGTLVTVGAGLTVVDVLVATLW